MNLKAIAAVGLIAVGAGAVAITVLGVGGSQGEAVTYRTAQAALTDVQQTAAASGSLAAATVYDLAFGETPTATDDISATSSATSSATTAAASTTAASNGGTGTGTASVTVTWPVTAVNVAVGDLVKSGDILAVADDTSAELAVRQAEANLAAARTQKKTDAAGGTATSRAQAKDQVTSAKTQLSNARSSYSSTVAQGNLKLKQGRQAVTAAKAQYKADKASGAPQQTLDQDTKAITAAEQNLASTKLQVAASNRQAANQVTSAKQSLASANRGYKTATTSADDATVITDDVAIAEAEQALADAEAALAMATITAPIDGRITVVNAVEGRESTGTAIELQSTRLALSVGVTEDDILDLAVGQKATVAISATGDTAIGTVTSVSPVASSSGSSTVVSYAVVVTLDEEPGRTTATGSDAPAVAAAASSPAVTSAAPLPGMSAEITIVIAEATDALAVPAIALSGTSGSYTVRVLNSDGTVEARSVDVGLIASDYAQITGGLAEGEAIVTGSSADRTLTSSSTSTTNDRGSFRGLDGGGGFQPPAGGFPGQP
jgi:multidrug efflux pump subunit AcrA (membrane-fusion protein)